MASSAEQSSSTTRRGNTTGARIIAVAERLYGIYGIESVSIRQITIEAGALNKSAVAYHFGDRENLIREILRQRLPRLEVARERLYREIVSENLGHDPYALARVLVLPAYDLVDGDGRRSYAGFLRQILRWERGRTLRNEMMDLSPSSTQAFRVFRRLFDRLSDDLFIWRSIVGVGLFFDLVFDRDRDIAAGMPVMEEDIFLKEAIGLMVACYKA